MTQLTPKNPYSDYIRKAHKQDKKRGLEQCLWKDNRPKIARVTTFESAVTITKQPCTKL